MISPVTMASDELLKPLGADRGDKPGRMRLPWVPVLSAFLFVIIGVAGLYAFVLGDPLGGQPHMITPIEVRRDAPPPEPQANERSAARIQQVPVEDRPKRTATEVEAASGVSVFRGDGSSAPSSVVIRVPDPVSIKLSPAPDRRLVERSRHGILPKIGDDGARAAMVYARPQGTLPGGMQPQGRIAIVVGGLGISANTTGEAISKLPPAITLAFAPYGSDLDRYVTRARDNGHEVMLQVPMEPFDYPDNDPGPHTLTVTGTGQANMDKLQWVMGRFTGYIGIINFMGAKLTADEAALSAVMREMGSRGLVFLDDGSSSRSLTARIGGATRTPTLKADMVIDAAARADAIDKELMKLEDLARKQGTVIATASALPLTVERLARWSKELEAKGLLLTPVSALYPLEKR
jgi:uncharacterized protein